MTVGITKRRSVDDKTECEKNPEKYQENLKNLKFITLLIKSLFSTLLQTVIARTSS